MLSLYTQNRIQCQGGRLAYLCDHLHYGPKKENKYPVPPFEKIVFWVKPIYKFENLIVFARLNTLRGDILKPLML